MLDDATEDDTLRVDLEEPLMAEFDYVSGSGLNRRRARIEAVVLLPSGRYGALGFCQLRGETRNFVISAMRRVEIVLPDRLAVPRSPDALQALFSAEIAELERRAVMNVLECLDDDPRLLLMAAICAAFPAMEADADAEIRSRAADRIGEFMKRAVRWVALDMQDLLARRMAQGIAVEGARLDRAIRGVFPRTRDEIFFEVSGLALLSPSPAAMGILSRIHAAFDETAADRPPPWYR